MATFTANSNGIYAKLVVTEQSQSVANNTTTLLWEIYMWNTTAKPNWYMYDQHNIFQVKINGEYVLNNSDFGRVSLQYEQPESAARLITSGTYTIAHNSDGTKTGVPVYLYAAQGWEYAYVWETSGTMNLTTIARASQPSLSASSVTLGSAVTIYTNRASSSFTHTLEYSIGSASGTIASGVGTSQSWTPSKELARQFPNATSGIVTITCKTYNGSTLIGTKPTFLTINISSDMIPSVSATISEAASIPSGISGYIKTRSKLRIVASASGSYGSTIMSYKITANGATYNASEATTGYLTTDGSNTITVTVTDSRGQPKTYSTTVTVLDYSPPRIDSLNAYRCNSSGTADAEGAYLKIEFTGTITSLNSKNSRTAYVQTKPSGGSWSTQGYTLGSGYSGFTGYTAVLSAATTTSYEVRVQVADSFGSSSFYTTTVSTASILMNILSDKSGMAIGKMAEKARTLQLGWDLEVFDQPANTVLAAPNGVDGVAQFRRLNETDIEPAWLVTGIGTSDTGWYRVFVSHEEADDASGWGAVEFKLGRSYNSPRNEIYQFAISVSYAGNIDITQLSGDIGGHLITKIRVVHASSKRFYIDFYANAGASAYTNTYYVYGVSGYGIFCAPTLAEIPDGYSAVEFDTVNGCKNNRGFTGNFNGNATSASYATSASCLAASTTFDPTDASVDSYKLKVYDSYNIPGTPSSYGNVLEINGTDGHWKPQLWFSGYSYGAILYRNRGYGDKEMGAWRTILDTNIVADYPVAQATSGHGIWSFIKFNSGIAMCWGQTAICNTAFSATWSSWYVHDYLFPAQRFPFDFVAIPQVFASQGPAGTTGCDWAIYSDGGVTTQYTPRYSAFRPKTTGATVNLSLNLFAIGRWK